MQLILALIFGLFFWHSALAQQSYPLYPFQCPSGQFVYGFNPATGGFPGWFCSTPAGGGGGGGLPSLANGQILGNATGSQATAAATNLTGTGSVTVSASGGTITINGTGGTNSLAPGLGLNLTTYNGTGSQQQFTSGATLFPQFGAYAVTTTPYTLNATSGGTAPCSSGVLCDTSRQLLANNSSSTTFKAPNPSGSLYPYSFGDEAGNGYSITTISGSATFFGCVTGSPTTLTVQPNYITEIADWGANANKYYCVESPQAPPYGIYYLSGAPTGSSGDQAFQTQCNNAQNHTLIMDIPITVTQTFTCNAGSVKFYPSAVLTVTSPAVITFPIPPTSTDSNIKIFSTSPGGILFTTANSNVSAAWFGPVNNASGTADQAPAFTAAAHSLSNGGTVQAPTGTYVLKSQIGMSPNVNLVCPSNGITFGSSGVPVFNAGTMFSVQWGSGPGSSNTAADAAMTLDTGAGTHYCGFTYPGQTYSASTPTEYGATILAYGVTNGDQNQSATFNFCFNCYSFLDFRGSILSAGGGINGANVTYNWGAPVAYGLRINNQNDWSWWDHNIFHACGYVLGGSLSTGICNWSLNNGIAIEVGPGDWENIDFEQEWGYPFGVEWQISGGSTYAKTGPLYVRNGQFDACQGSCIQINPVSSGAAPIEVDITDNRFTPYNPVTSSASATTGGIAAEANADFTGIFNFQNNFMFGPMNYMVFISGFTDATIVNNRYSSATGISTNSEPLVTTSNGTTLIFEGNYAHAWPGTLDSLGTISNIPFTPSSYNFLN